MDNIKNINKPIGGFFEIELCSVGDFPHSHAIAFQSGRAAFYALINSVRPSRIWIPRYICNSMLAPILASGIAYSWYDLTHDLNVDRRIQFATGDVILYVDYFGICNRHIRGIINDFGKENVILDFSQSFFAKPGDCLGSLYSARKFVGVPDGAFLYTKALVERPTQLLAIDSESIPHLMGRLTDGPEKHYDSFNRHESQFDDFEARAPSQLTYRILSSIDWDYVKKCRIENFIALHDELGSTNKFPIENIPVDAPLCYPYVGTNDDLRSVLQRERIYVPTYWKEVLTRTNLNSIEFKLTTSLMALPYDQRYVVEDMKYLATCILKNYNV